MDNLQKNIKKHCLLPSIFFARNGISENSQLKYIFDKKMKESEFQAICLI